VHYKGADGVRQFVADMGESWASFAFEIEDARDLGDRVLIVGKQRGRGRSSGIDVESERAFIVELWRGRLISLRFFLQPDDALEAAGLAE
jgi:ketosteroid isomerase-like protein